MKSKTLTSLLLAMIASPAAVFAGPMTAVPIHGGDNAGRLWDNGGPRNNDQRGAGAEHSSCAWLKTKKSLVCLSTASYTDISNAGAVNIAETRIQGLCASYKFDPMTGLKPIVTKYVSNNESPDYQNYHKVAARPVADGNYVMSMYGYDPNGVNTATYAQILDENCNNMAGQEFAQTLIIAKNNDDVGGNNWLGAPLVDSATGSKACGTQIGNGNGQDDGWLTCVKVEVNGAKVTVAKIFDQSIVTNEERSRTVCAPTASPNKVVCSWAEGNNQPPDRGVRVGLIDVSDAAPQGGRILFKQYIKQREGNIYYSTPDLVNVPKADGTPSNDFVMSYVKIDRNGINGRNKGKTNQFTVPLTVSDTAATMAQEPVTGILGAADAAHPGMISGVFGPDKRFVTVLTNPTITDGGTGNFTLVGKDATGKLEKLSTVDMGMPLAGGWISQRYGNNPNTPQGRNYAPDGLMVDNPGFGVVGGYQPLVEKFMVMSVSGTKKRGAGTGGGTGDQNQDKLGWDIVLVPMVEGNVVDPTDPDAPTPTDPSNPTPTDPSNPTPTDNNGGGIGGCSTGGANSAGLGLVVLGLALAGRRRRN
jgi:MYXO-CTERM domain-containing protein